MRVAWKSFTRLMLHLVFLPSTKIRQVLLSLIYRVNRDNFFLDFIYLKILLSKYINKTWIYKFY